MSDTFDHEGDAWHSYESGREIDEPTYFGRCSDHTTWCKHCYMPGLKWRLADTGWRLFENRRDEHNAKIEHNCRATSSLDDFEVLA